MNAYYVNLDIVFSNDGAYSPYLNGVGIHSRFDTDHVIKCVDKWILKCNSQKHKSCKVPEYSTLPTRVLDLGDPSSNSKIKLFVTNKHVDQYISLSYCWGNIENTLKTTKGNLQDHINGIPWGVLPKTFQDAIILTKALKIRYLWIDALCILQGDREDWENESVKMGKVYSNSYLTIAATAGINPQKGLFLDRWTQMRHYSQQSPITFSVEDVDISCDKYPTAILRPQLWLGEDQLSLDHRAAYKRVQENSPLLTRAWAFQERFLSPRTLHFHCEELIMECKSENQRECCKSSLVNGLKEYVYSESSSSTEQRGEQWLKIVSWFTALQITYLSDRMAALAGFTEAFDTLSRKNLGLYFAGIWEHDLVRGLLFSCIDPELRTISTNNTSDSRPPSWSWTSAAFDGFYISYDPSELSDFVPEIKVQKVSCKPVTPNSPFGWATDGILEIKCKVRKVSAQFDGISKSYNLSVMPHLKNARYPNPYLEYHDDQWKLDLTADIWCLLVGYSNSGRYQWSLVLQKSKDHPSCYERIDVLRSWLFRKEDKNRAKLFYSDVEMQEIVLV
ncbi:hypothetical protein NHQ30_010856 [Ciborinia camelliae]|nr:hypothetical protein NHQ30_010856 [Ciborinia camelliae]